MDYLTVILGNGNSYAAHILDIRISKIINCYLPYGTHSRHSKKKQKTTTSIIIK